MNRISALAAVGALFLVGVLVGALGMHLYVASSAPPPGPPTRAGSEFRGGWRLAPGRTLERLSRELELTPEQRGEIGRILREEREELESLRRELRPRVEGRLERTRERIRSVLDPDQVDRFDEMRPLRPPRGRRPGPGRQDGGPI